MDSGQNKGRVTMLKLGLFEENVAAALTKGAEEIHCSVMSLVQNTDENPVAYRGPGYLKRDPSNGQIVFKIFATILENSPPHQISLGKTKPGQLFKKSEYFCLSATDEYSRTWNAEYIFPILRTLQAKEGFETNCQIVVSGRVHELKSTGQWSSDSEKLKVLMLRFSEDVQIPFNEATETFSTVAGGNKQGHWTANASKFSSLGCDFIMQQEEELLQIEVRSEALFPAHFDVRILETLQFVLARTINWQVLAYYNDDALTIRLNSSAPTSRTTKFKPPITEQHARFLGSHHFYNLIDKYLCFVCKSEVVEWHACSKLLHQAIQSGSNTIQLVALGLGVVVEGFVKEFFEEFKSDSAGLDAAIEALMLHNEVWKTLPGWNDDDFRQKRIAKALKSLRKTSTADRLYHLARNGAVERRLVDHWKDVRHPTAHGVSLGDDHQNTLDSIHAVNVLVYQIIFFLINYQGCYVDFSTHGYPIANYPLEAAIQ